jgi:hypothetical protein
LATAAFNSAIAAALKAAREHAVLVRDIDEAEHIHICYQFAESVQRVFSQATLASDALRAHEQYDANRSARISSLTIKRNFFSSSTLHFRVEAADRDVWWQLRDAPASWEYAGWGWFVVPVLTAPDFDAYLQQKVLDLSEPSKRTRRPAPSLGTGARGPSHTIGGS